jgi:RNA polymerase sigma-70 factor (ECF subfamily)
VVDVSNATPPGEEEDDFSLVERLQRRDPTGLALLWKRYAALLYSQASRILNNPTETEDIVAEVFEEVWERIDGYRPERARPVAWLVTLVRRRAIDRLRERQSYQRAEERLFREDSADPKENSNDVQKQIQLSDLRRIIEKALGRLPHEQREAVRMAYYEGLSQREIAESTHTPLGTVKTRLELALRKMRAGLRETDAREATPEHTGAAHEPHMWLPPAPPRASETIQRLEHTAS